MSNTIDGAIKDIGYHIDVYGAEKQANKISAEMAELEIKDLDPAKLEDALTKIGEFAREVEQLGNETLEDIFKEDLLPDFLRNLDISLKKAIGLQEDSLAKIDLLADFAKKINDSDLKAGNKRALLNMLFANIKDINELIDTYQKLPVEANSLLLDAILNKAKLLGYSNTVIYNKDSVETISFYPMSEAEESRPEIYYAGDTSLSIDQKKDKFQNIKRQITDALGLPENASTEEVLNGLRNISPAKKLEVRAILGSPELRGEGWKGGVLERPWKDI